MGDPSSKVKAAVVISVWLALMALVWFLSSTFFSGSHTPNSGDAHDPYPAMEKAFKASLEKAKEIAVAEVKKREGWTGVADDEVDHEGDLWYVVVKGKPGPRYITVADGKVVSYATN